MPTTAPLLLRPDGSINSAEGTFDVHLPEEDGFDSCYPVTFCGLLPPREARESVSLQHATKVDEL